MEIERLAPMIVVGAGQAGLQAAESLRAEGWDGPILLLGEENRAPYHRPPLSKEGLSGSLIPEAIAIRGPEAIARKGIEHRSGCRVRSIAPTSRSVLLDSGERLTYHKLILAVGARNRLLPVPQADLPGVFYLRTLDEALALRAAIAAARHVAVIGAGFVGLEIAASCRALGREVTVVEAAPRVLARVASPLLSGTIERLHAVHGVTLECGAAVASLLGTRGRAAGVLLSDGRTIPADLVVVGIGAVAAVELAEAAGLSCDNGIVIDSCGRTSDPDILAAGDCAAMRLHPGMPPLRLESVQAAVEQGKAAAAAALGREKPFTGTPWFWSNQYEVKLQMAGRLAAFDKVVTRGDPHGFQFSAFYFDQDRLVAADSLNRPGDHMAARRILDRGLSLTPEQAGNDGVDLSALARG